MSVAAKWTGTCTSNQSTTSGALTLFNGTLYDQNAVSNHGCTTYNANFSIDFSVKDSSLHPSEVIFLFANLTKADSAMQQAYCLNPPNDGDCSTWSLCPQPDISGPLVTFATLITHFGLAVLIWLEQEVAEAFWSHMFTICAILTTTFIAIGSGQLARSHAFAAGMLIASPPTLYIWFCAVRACIKDASPTRLHDIVGRVLGRSVALASMVAWFVLAALVGTPSDGEMFSQRHCDGEGLLFYTLGVNAKAGGLWAALAASFALPWATSLWFHWAIRRSHSLGRVADPVYKTWKRLHPLLQFCMLALVPTIALALLFIPAAQRAIKSADATNPWQLRQPLAFLLYTWLPMFFWILVGFWKRFVSWESGEEFLCKFWNVFPMIIRFVIVVGFPTGAWLAVVIPNMVNPTGAWISYGQLLALFATTPVIVGVARALFMARIEPWLHRRRGTVQPAAEEALPLRRHHTKSSTLDSEFETTEFEVARDSPPSSRFEEERDGLFPGAQMVERRSFQVESGPNTPYFGGRFDYGTHSPRM